MIRLLEIPVGWGNTLDVIGGPFFERPNIPNILKVKVAREINLECDVNLKIQDYSIPNTSELYEALNTVIDHALAGKPVFVGCMAGRGRTGLFLSCLVKALGVKNPVQYVRDLYYHHAVETPEQERYIANLVIPFSIKKKIFLFKVKSLLKFIFNKKIN